MANGERYEHLKGKLRFPVGRMTATKTIVEDMTQNATFKDFIEKCLERHVTGDWGDLDEESKISNEKATEANDPGKILSSYDIPEYLMVPYMRPDNKIWIITEWDRTIATILYPSEY